MVATCTSTEELPRTGMSPSSVTTSMSIRGSALLVGLEESGQAIMDPNLKKLLIVVAVVVVVVLVGLFLLNLPTETVGGTGAL